jgi:hypothetical protein
MLNPVGVACKLIGHAASIGHSCLVGQNRNGIGVGIHVKNDGND